MRKMLELQNTSKYVQNSQNWLTMALPQKKFSKKENAFKNTNKVI